MKTVLSRLSAVWPATGLGRRRSRKAGLERAMEKNLTTLDTIGLVASITSLLALSLAQQIVGVNLLQKPEEGQGMTDE